MEWQRDDRLGRSWQWQQFEHGREILRGIRFVANSNANCDGNCYSDVNSDPHIYSKSYADADTVHGKMFTYA